jgi:hypothetical protein
MAHVVITSYEGLLSRPLEVGHPSVVTVPVADEVILTSVDQHSMTGRKDLHSTDVLLVTLQFDSASHTAYGTHQRNVFSEVNHPVTSEHHFHSHNAIAVLPRLDHACIEHFYKQANM